MMKVQLTEFQIIALLIFAPIVFLVAATGNAISLAVVCLLLLLINAVYPTVVMVFSERRYGRGIVYNRLFGVIEFHLTRTKNWGNFAKKVSRLRRVAKELNKPVLFLTNHYEETRLKELAESFKFDIEIKPANKLQKFVYLLNSHIVTIGMDGKRSYPVLRCVVRFR
ncbi:hypothetical protein QUF95_07235 [Paenibacillus silvae]|uniref:hypothetical protein n=1 Tax=Paenibacillus silvae TaxID=1325358 RepID=UPI00259FF839|nr:hypothetical protein [Paenibacillus silvae]MDM5277169.1 hypothetical protein [Paenibacillus silvae]